MLRAICLSVSLVVGAGPALAQSPVALRETTLAMLDAIGMEQSINIMVQAGVRDGRGLEDDLFPGRGGAAWGNVVDRLYAHDTLRGFFYEGFPEDRLSEDRAAEITAFFSSDLGERIVEGELTAWEAITDQAVEDAANEVYFQQLAEANPRLELLERFTEVNGFVDFNVMGALNANFAFLRGMSDGGAYERPIPEDMILTQVWQGEPEIREDTILWLYSFQLMAYADLSDEELEAYIAFSESDAGQLYNSTVFAGYDAVFSEMSYRLGNAAAVFMTGEPT
ncbi:DUF2059 domain-containing protein [Nioella ostreopsis]|uniref:DUF2059 domain-containing protein n=1 Tax=Nioella ostreopsis TaxID=2448479 RepID=UPI000FD8E213|nr:DUF2059 domain-containing protein [Nioella ostreopsis]